MSSTFISEVILNFTIGFLFLAAVKYMLEFVSTSLDRMHVGNQALLLQFRPGRECWESEKGCGGGGGVVAEQ